MGKIIAVIIILLVVGAGLYYWSTASKKNLTPFSNNSPTQSENAPSQAAPVIQNPSADAPAAGTTREITISGNEFAFEPSTVTLKMGEPVQITFKNTGKYPHNFSLSDFGVSTPILAPGQQRAIVFAPDKTGEFSFTCTVGSHAEKGMVGKVIVQ